MTFHGENIVAGLVALALLASAGGAAAPARPARAPLIATQAVDPDAADARARAAFRAVYGRDGPVGVRFSDSRFALRPVAAIDIGPGRIALLSHGVDRQRGPSSAGVNAIHYLVRRNGEWHARGGWLGIGVDSSANQPAARWAVTRSLSRWPILYLEGSGVRLGCRTASATLTELRPDAAVDVVTIPLSFSDVETGRSPSITLRGTLASAVPDRSFTMRYSGNMRFSETWRRAGDRYRTASGESRVPLC
jgi:hypothetical protein